MRMERGEPILPARDLSETCAFYERLGFTSWWKGRGSREYDILSRGHLVVHFYAESSLVPDANESRCYWRVKDADLFYRECAALNLPSEGIPRLTAPADEPWGMREFTFVDPSGNLIRVGHDLNADAAYAPADSESSGARASAPRGRGTTGGVTP